MSNPDRRKFLAQAAVAAFASVAGAGLVACAREAKGCSADPEHVKADFAAGRIVVVDGWILSATEARECSLASILRV